MNYEENRQASLMQIAEMSRTLEKCGIGLRDEYTFDDALEFAGKRLLEVADDGYSAMLALAASHSHTGRRVSDDILFVNSTLPMTHIALEKLMREVSTLARHPIRMDNLCIKYNVIYRPYKKRRIKSSNIFAEVSFDLPDAPAVWHISSAEDEAISNIPNIKNARVGDTVINSPSAEWQIKVSGVRLLSHISECLMRGGSKLGLYFYETNEGCYVIAKSSGEIYEIKSSTGLAFFPVPEPDYDDELYEQDDELARESEMEELTRLKDDDSEDAPDGSALAKGNAQFEDLISEYPDAAAEIRDAAQRETGLPEIAGPALFTVTDNPDDDEDNPALDAELTEKLGYESESGHTVRDDFKNSLMRFAKLAIMSPRARSDLREHEYLEVRDKLVQLAQRGLRMNSGYLLREVIKSEGIRPASLKRMGWEGLLWFLCGVDKLNNEIRPYSDDIMLYDYRDYGNKVLLIELTRNIQRMTRGALHFGAVAQQNDRGGRPAIFEFVQGGHKHKWRLRTDTGGAQLTDFFEHMAELMRDNGCTGNLWYFESGSKCYYMYVSHKNGLRLRRLTGLPLQAVLRD